MYFDIDYGKSNKGRNGGISRNLRPLLKSSFYRKKSSLNLICDSKTLSTAESESFHKGKFSASEHHKFQRRVSEKTWKANFYKYGLFRRACNGENEVSEIQEEPEEDQDENLSRILNNFATPVL
jgi:hypothetical protein